MDLLKAWRKQMGIEEPKAEEVDVKFFELLEEPSAPSECPRCHRDHRPEEKTCWWCAWSFSPEVKE